jgi:hypothetical protein
MAISADFLVAMDSPWDGLPMFSAWVSEPAEAEAAETQPGS